MGLLATLYFAAGGIGCFILIVVAALIDALISLVVMLLWNAITPAGWHTSWFVVYGVICLLTIVAAFFNRT
jgi:hypothetical protein